MCHFVVAKRFSYAIIYLTEKLKKGCKMKELLELEYLKAKVANLDQKISIYNDQFGPSDDHVVKLKNEVKKLDALILDLMVAVQENSVLKAVI
jgi:hypothetical protein